MFKKQILFVAFWLAFAGAVHAATITKDIANHADGLVVFQIDYSDVSMLLTAFRCINNSDSPAYARASLTDGSRERTAIFAANVTTTITVPTGQAQRLQLTINAKGTLDGVMIETQWPAP